MNYLLAAQIMPFLKKGNSLEQFLEFGNCGEYKTIRWIEIGRAKDDYELSYHEVFDERNECLENIYDYSYVEPDDLYGKLVLKSSNLDEVLRIAKKKFEIDLNLFLPHGDLSDEL